MWLFYYFHFDRNCDVLKSKSPCILLTLVKTKRNRKWRIPRTDLERWNLRFSSYKNCKLKVKLWWARERKKKAFFVPFILSEMNLFNICVFSQRIVDRINFQNYILLHIKKHYSTHYSCLLLKSSKAFNVSLSHQIFWI